MISREVSEEVGKLIFDDAAKSLLGISGDEFLRRWDAGEYDDEDDPVVALVAIMIPFARNER